MCSVCVLLEKSRALNDYLCRVRLHDFSFVLKSTAFANFDVWSNVCGISLVLPNNIGITMISSWCHTYLILFVSAEYYSRLLVNSIGIFPLKIEHNWNNRLLSIRYVILFLSSYCAGLHLPHSGSNFIRVHLPIFFFLRTVVSYTYIDDMYYYCFYHHKCHYLLEKALIDGFGSDAGLKIFADLQKFCT